MGIEDEIKARREQDEKRRKDFEKEQKDFQESFRKKKEQRRIVEAEKKERNEKNAVRQSETNKAIEALVSESFAGDTNTDTAKNSSALARSGGLFTGKGGGTTGQSSKKSNSMPFGSVIPGLADARVDKEKQKRFSVNQGGRFTSNTATGKSGVGTAGGGGSSLRKGVKF
jgi:hypothetical protein